MEKLMNRWVAVANCLRNFRGGLWAISLCATSVLAQPEPVMLEQHYDGVLGTSLDVTMWGTDAASMESAVTAALAEITRLDAILSTWRDDSTLMMLNRNRSGDNLPPELVEVVTLCESWRERSAGVFSCRLGQIAQIWKTAQEQQQLPVVMDLLKLTRQINQSELTINADTRAITLGEGIDLEPSGLAKGYIIDRAVAVLRAEAPDATAIKVDIGGDAMYWGAPPDSEGWAVQVAGPAPVADNGGFIATLSLSNRAVATSGHTSRTYKIRTLEYSHIFDTRRGWSVSDGSYAVATAPDAVTADALATILAAQAFTNAQPWAAKLDDSTPVLIVGLRDMQWQSRGWTDLLNGEMRRQLRARIMLTMDYTIPRLRDRIYNRPYVAVWVGDSKGIALQDLLLLGGEERWANSNSVWWRRTGSRSNNNPSYNVTRPTRGPGDYQLVWDGKDSAGNSLPAGDYVLNVEASRQDGGHDYVSQPFTIANGTARYENPGQGEVGPFSFTLNVLPAE